MSEKNQARYYYPYRLFKYLAYLAWPSSVFIVTVHSTYIGENVDTTKQSSNIILGLGLLFTIIFFLIRMYYLAKLESSYIQGLIQSITTRPQKSMGSISKRSVLVTNSSKANLHFQKKKNNILFSRLWTEYFSNRRQAAIWTVHMDAVVISFQLPARFPHTFIDGKGQNMFTPTSFDLWVLKSKLKDVNRKLDPEGLFPKDFSVYSAVEHDSDVLRILTPDVMEAILELGRDIDVEIIDDQVNIIIDRKVMRTQLISKTAVNIDHLMEELLQELKRTHDNWKHNLILSTSILQLPFIQFAYIFLYSRVVFVLAGIAIIFLSVLAGALIGELLKFIL